MDTTSPITHVSLCAGYGGIDLGLKRAIPALRTIAFSEIEAYACANLVSKMEAGLLDAAPVWTDLKTFPWSEFHGCVDILSGGYPCQPFSAAGKRLGAEDPRHLWPFIAAGIAAMRPSCCFFENVEGHISLGLPDVLQDLAGMGYRTTWCVASASEVGAPHQRKRVFILAECSSQRSASGLSRQIAGQEGIAGIADYGGDHAWPSRPRELGNAQHDGLHGPAFARGNEVYAGTRQKEESQVVEQCAGAGGVGSTLWPSRPGEQQFWWEPPRVVVADAASQRSRSSRGDAIYQGRPASTSGRESVSTDAERQVGAAIADDQSAGGDGGECSPRAMANSSGQRAGQRSELRGEECGSRSALPHCNDEGQGPWGKESERDGVVADAQRELRQGRPERIGRWIGQPREVECDVADSGSEGNGMRQTQPPLGRDADGPADWLDDAELQVTCDNRTDELRLLGNGVVPATAERAFRVLFSELAQEQP